MVMLEGGMIMTLEEEMRDGDTGRRVRVHNVGRRNERQ